MNYKEVLEITLSSDLTPAQKEYRLRKGDYIRTGSKTEKLRYNYLHFYNMYLSKEVGATARWKYRQEMTDNARLSRYVTDWSNLHYSLAIAWLKHFSGKKENKWRLRYGEGGWLSSHRHANCPVSGITCNDSYNRLFYGYKIVKRVGSTWIEIFSKKGKRIGEIFIPRGFKGFKGLHPNTANGSGAVKILYWLMDGVAAYLYGEHHEFVGIHQYYEFFESRTELFAYKLSQ
jgi:hypothetical protein